MRGCGNDNLQNRRASRSSSPKPCTPRSERCPASASSLPPRPLKGLAGDVGLLLAEWVEPREPMRDVDPVCGMELSAADAAVRLSLGARDLVFCSAACLQRYVEAPARYGG